MKLQFYSPASRPPDEHRRQSQVDSLVDRGIADRESLQRIVVEAAKLLDCPIAAVSIIDGDRQWFAASQGLEVEETSRAVSFCAHTILAPDEIFCVADAAEDRRFAGNPLVMGGPGVRFYAGAPLKGPDGAILGALCTIDTQARQIDGEKLEQLRTLARAASDILERMPDATP